MARPSRIYEERMQGKGIALNDTKTKKCIDYLGQCGGDVEYYEYYEDGRWWHGHECSDCGEIQSG